MRTRTIGRRWAALAAIMVSSCGRGADAVDDDSTHSSQVIIILEARPAPEESTIAVGERVSFMDHDTTSYTIAGGREPSSPDCPEITVIGVLAPGHTRMTEPFTPPRPAHSTSRGSRRRYSAAESSSADVARGAGVVMVVTSFPTFDVSRPAVGSSLRLRDIKCREARDDHHNAGAAGHVSG